MTQPRLSRAVVLLMAVATGISVANLYYCQPLLELISGDLGISAASAGALVTMTQIGYALGLLFVLPLGDLIERRGLIVGLSLACVGALVLTATAQNAPWLFAASILLGVLTVVAQVLVPLAATLAEPQEQGTVVGIVMSGLLLGILLARTVAGLLAEVGGWRSVYWIAAVAMLAVTLALWRGLPQSRPTQRSTYGALMLSIGHFIRTEPVLRRRMAYGALTFFQFSVLWTALTGLLAGAPYHYSEGVIGLFGLIGVAGALAAQLAGRYADRGRALRLTVIFTGLLVVSWLALALGKASLAALVVGIVVLDAGVQGMQVTNQTQIYAISQEGRARVNAAYMTSYFAGGAIGSLVSTRVAASGGWVAVCWLGVAVAVAQLLLVALGERLHRRADQSSPLRTA
ncbi:putative MFS family arabinose efflux permease [Branchiibius hedensis]|uniref:Predicted arabinose efflux permease, MFS family n=1 Tax=Branchiibius hedensis TaxID=672460 RepID=A0A2Y8ZW08_9MICO|nr:MFS transporter [Branchiibius hedensis]PWJ27314.1 putative MFS family arabinose efflux permease [Branchiibius hedensis]SSA36125.1 Predicted arabinose efflux permease, MFS family [Branchiibius hedensis]